MSQQILESISPFVAGVPPATSIDRKPDIEELVKRFGANSTSYVLLEGKKQYYTSSRVEGFIAYQLSAGVIVVGGDPVCEPKDAPVLIADFLAEMKSRQVCAYQVSPEMLQAFRANGFGDVQIGKEAVFDLKQFSLAGGAMELVRAATNKARREGVVVIEHDPFAAGAAQVNSEIEAISAEWLIEKGNREMGFLLGGLDLHKRTDKRYFIARSGKGLGRIEGFIVCEPIFARRGYYLDVTRRRRDAVRGTMELLTAEIFSRLGSEGYEIASMGLAPLANLDDPDLSNHPRLAGLMRFIYERVSRTYDFKQLYRYKAKYHPHAWESRYLCFRPRVTSRILYATLNVRDAFSLRETLGNHVSAVQNRGRQDVSNFLSGLKLWIYAASLILGIFCAVLLIS